MMNQLQVSVAMGQHGSQICYATFLVKNHKISCNSVTAKDREKVSTDMESLEF